MITIALHYKKLNNKQEINTFLQVIKRSFIDFYVAAIFIYLLKRI